MFFELLDERWPELLVIVGAGMSFFAFIASFF